MAWEPSDLGIGGLVLAAVSLVLLILGYLVLSWVTVAGGLIKYGADFGDVHRAMELGGGTPPVDYNVYFSWFAYLLLIVCPLVAIAANLGLPTRVFKLLTIVLSAIGAIYTFEIVIHIFADASGDGGIHVGAGPWIAILGYAAAAIAGALAP